MISTQTTHRFDFLMRFVNIYLLQHNIQEWIRKELVDDDPCDEETFFPTLNQGKADALDIAYMGVLKNYID